LCCGQGDQIGRIFAQRAIVFICTVFRKITEVAQIFRLLLSRLILRIKLSKWVGLGTFWALCSPTHSVTLSSAHPNVRVESCQLYRGFTLGQKHRNLGDPRHGQTVAGHCV
jgi:hypothetical protein